MEYRFVVLLVLGAVLGAQCTVIKPPTECCPENEHYVDKCGQCDRTCKNIFDPKYDGKNCAGKPGCYCDDGYVRDESCGKCVEKCECPPPIVCCPNSKWKCDCDDCEATCKNGGKPGSGPCPKISGCFCDEGYVKNKEGYCVKLEQCPPLKVCCPNSKWKWNCDECEATCENGGKPGSGPCPKKDDCFCDYGYVKNKEGYCVKLDKCPPLEDCGCDATWKWNCNDCEATCKNGGKTNGTCDPTSGCFCKKPYVKNDEGKCVKRDKCPPLEDCGCNATWTWSTKECDRTCKNGGKPKGKCVERYGCMCNKGFVKSDAGDCIKLCDCQTPDCGTNQEWIWNNKRCERYCKDNIFTCMFRICKETSGCFCKDGYYMNDKNCCVERCQCPKKCKKNEEWVECINALCSPISCSDLSKPSYCPSVDKCIGGCACIKDYLRNKFGMCIKKTDCPLPDCGCNAIWKWNCNECEGTCKDEGKTCGTCPERSGCFCKTGYVRDDNNKCTKRCDCQEQCGDNEEYLTCGTACPATCDNPNPEKCTKNCVKGCFCRKGYIRNTKTNKCILKKDCPKDCGCEDYTTQHTIDFTTTTE